MKKHLLAIAVLALASCTKENIGSASSLDDYAGLYAGEYSIESSNGKANSAITGDTIISVGKSIENNCLVVADIYFTVDGSIIQPLSSRDSKERYNIYFRKDILYINQTEEGKVIRIQLKETQH